MTTKTFLHRYFFAALPDPISRARIHAWTERRLGHRGLQPAERLHLTLGITADFSEPEPAVVEALIRAGNAIQAAAFDLPLDRLSIGGRSSALRPAKTVAPLRSLQAALTRAMVREGVTMRPGWTFSPHVTLSYRDSRPATQPVKDRGWHVGEFVLVHSLVGLTRHEILARWRLEDEEPDRQFSLFSA
ncbi:MAG TPA: 2'-5' RNA ligase family protein [Sphingomonadaceae bacterium]